MARPDPALALLGLAARAGVVVRGTERVRQAVSAGIAAYVIVAEDASANAVDKVVPLLERRGVAHARRYSRGQVGESVGRSPLSAVAITDRGFARRLAVLVDGPSEVVATEKQAGQSRQS
ncbi:MAG: L7Ae/L30e/S12e/Gadd45 family ribosomal protein [Longimicrobiales bacterium]